MKYIFLTLIYFSSFHFLFCQKTEDGFTKTFSFQLYRRQYDLSIIFSDGNITGHRTAYSILSDISVSSIFIECEVRISALTDGSLQINAIDTNTWFIPINPGEDPIKLGAGDCIRIGCFSRPGCTDLEILTLNDRVTVIGDF